MTEINDALRRAVNCLYEMITDNHPWGNIYSKRGKLLFKCYMKG